MKLLVMLLLAAGSSAMADTLVGRVVGVTDGDTITLLSAENKQHKIRLSGIDAPEMSQPYGQDSKQSLSHQVYGRQVSIETSKKDRYGRDIGKILVDGNDANLEQVKRGFAWHYKRYQNEQPLEDRLAYARTEDEARAAQRGLWVDAAPMAPWDWRRRK